MHSVLSGWDGGKERSCSWEAGAGACARGRGRQAPRPAPPGRMQPGVTRPPVVALWLAWWLCGLALWEGICAPRYYQCLCGRINHGQEKINIGCIQPCLSQVRFIL